MATAKLFWSGNSQAVRLPKDFRFDAESVRIEKQGNKVIIEPIIDNWDWLDSLGEPDPSLEAEIKLARTESQERDWSCFE
ncbi:hypothetical protein A1D22_03125 [Pasteurellaceae bacterium LFhippo2]|nr:hypothetical protein [Pasteurellaceae bacterium LFhippo2]